MCSLVITPRREEVVDELMNTFDDERKADSDPEDREPREQGLHQCTPAQSQALALKSALHGAQNTPLVVAGATSHRTQRIIQLLGFS